MLLHIILLIYSTRLYIPTVGRIDKQHLNYCSTLTHDPTGVYYSRPGRHRIEL